VLASTLVLLVWPLLSVRTRPVVLGLAGVWVVLTCADRIFLGAHFPSDVLGGGLVGGGLVWAAYAGYRGWTPTLPAPENDPTPRTTARPSKESQ
jgi:undecaprenyl-diphosphatase